MDDEFEFDPAEGFRKSLEKDLKAIIRHGSDSHGRSQQKEIGPSEIGAICSRQLAFKLTATPRASTKGDPLASIIGTAAHSWMEDAVKIWNEQLGRVRFITEQKVVWRKDYRPGTCDCFDLDTQTVIDWKFPGPSRFKHYRTHGPSRLYKTQFHTYGKGYEDTFGVPVKHVGGFFIPRAGLLSSAFLWTEPYNRDIAVAAVSRIEAIEHSLTELDVENHPERFELIPKTPSEDCRFCSWWSPNPTGPRQCSGGETTEAERPFDAIEKLRKGLE